MDDKVIDHFPVSEFWKNQFQLQAGGISLSNEWFVMLWTMVIYRLELTYSHFVSSLVSQVKHPGFDWLVGCIGVKRHFNSHGHIMAVGEAHVFPGFLTPVLTQLFLPKPPTTFLTCFCRGERQKYTGKNSRLNRGSNSQPPGHESDTLIAEPPGWAPRLWSALSKGTCAKP